jgi:ABC-type molybdate transport system substrate-binding protein
MAAARKSDSIKQDAHQMLKLLDSPSGVDYAFVYKSQAVEQNLQIVELPKEINLSDTQLADLYGKVKLPAPVNRTGAPIAFSTTLLKKAVNPAGALDFLAFALGPQGRALLRGNRAVAAFTIIHPPLVDHSDKLPPELKRTMNDER